METYIVSVGDAFNGLTLYGPFKDWQQAADFDDQIEDADHCIVRVQEPKAAKGLDQ